MKFFARSVMHSYTLVGFLLIVLVLFLQLHCKPVKALGENPSGEELKKIEALSNYKNGQFRNLDTSLTTGFASTSSRRPRWLGMLKYFTGKPKITKPPKRVPVVLTDLVKSTYATPTVIWFGHSSFLLKTPTATILFDPNFSGYAGPFPGLIQAFEGSNAFDARDMPQIDALVISHDHYDHLDYETVKKLKKKVKRVIVPVGVGSHFRKWGYAPEMITELNWNDSAFINKSVSIVATPAHHRSNRTFESRKTLWASYVIRADGYKIYFSGDTGYSKHFKLIGEQYGPFNLAMLECGQYNTKWPQSHMFPYQTARAANDLKAAMTIPIHWGKFAESEHPWNESVNLLLKSADSLQLPVSIPFIGQSYSVGDTALPRNYWWNMK